MTKESEINESVKRYFDAISKSDSPLQVSLSDKNNLKLSSLCEKLDQLYVLRNKLKKDFFNYLESDQYYYDIYQTIKCLGLTTPSIKSNYLGQNKTFTETEYGKHLLNHPYEKFRKEYDKKLSSFSEVDLEPIENNNIQLKKMRKFVEDHLIHILVADAYKAIRNIENFLNVFITVPSEHHIGESNKMKIFLKKKSNEKLEVYIKRIKKMLIEMDEDNIFEVFDASFGGDIDVTGTSIVGTFKLYSNKQNLSLLCKQSFFYAGGKVIETINFGINFSQFFSSDKIAFTLISKLLSKIYFKKSLSIEAKYRDEIEKIEQGIRTDCLYLKKKMNINYSINLCEKLIKDSFDHYNNLYSHIGTRWWDRGYLDIFHAESSQFHYGGGYKFVPKFFIHRTKFYQEENLQHPIDINGLYLIKDLELFVHSNLNVGHSSYLFKKLFANSNTIHDVVPDDKYGDPNPVNEDWSRGMKARYALSEDLCDKFQNFIKRSDALKIKQKDIDWIQLELINYFEDNQEIEEVFIKNISKYKHLILQNDAVLLSRINGILDDYESYEKEIQKLRKVVHLNYRKIIKNHTKFQSDEFAEIDQFLIKISQDNPKHKKFAYEQIVLYEDPYSYDYRKKTSKDYEYVQEQMKEQNDREPFSHHNISMLRDILKKDPLLEEDNKYLRDWYISYSQMKRFHDRPKFLSSNQQKIFNVDDLFKFENHFLGPNNKGLKDLLSQLFNYINIDQSIATVFQELIEERTKGRVFKDHDLFDEFPQIKIKNNNDYASGMWWLIYNFISAQKSQIYHSFNNSVKDIILRALLFIRGIYPYRSGNGLKDPYERITTELTKAISFYDSISEQIYRDKISITASLTTNEIINSLRCIRDYIYTLKIANVYEIENVKSNNIINKDIKKSDLQFISRSPQWRNEIPIDFDLAIKKYLKECDKTKKGEDENFINKQVYDKTGKQELKTAKNNKSLIDRNSALKWLKQRSGKYKLNDLKVNPHLKKDISFSNYGLYIIAGDTYIKSNN